MKNKNIRRKKYIIITIIIMIAILIGTVSLIASNSFNKKYLALGDSITAGYALSDPTNQRYSKLVKDHYGIVDSNYKNLAVSGMTCYDFASYIRREDVTKAIKEADLLTVSIGSNELLGIAWTYFNDFSLSKALDFYELLQNDPKGEIAAAIKTYETKWKESINYIKSINPNIDIVALEFYNPYSGLNIDLLVKEFPVGDMIGGYINQMNQILWEYSILNNKTEQRYKIAEIYDAFEVEKWGGHRLTNVNFSSITNFNYDPHPTTEGHKKIKDRVIEALTTKISDLQIKYEVNPAIYEYTGKTAEPSIIVKDGERQLKIGTDYTVEYLNNIEPLSGSSVKIKGKGYYTGETTRAFNIIKRKIENTEIIIDNLKQYTYTGEPIIPDITITNGDLKLEEGKDYTVSYNDNINVGTVEVTIEGIGKHYQSSVIKTFDIIAKNIGTDTVRIEHIPDQIYTRQEIKPEIVIYDGKKLIDENYYTVLYEENRNAGKAKVTIIGQNNYVGVLNTTFKILEKDINILTIGNITSQKYTGEEIKPQVVIKDGNYQLVEDKDYNVIYNQNTEVGTAEIIIIGINNYSGASRTTFDIVKEDITKKDINKLTIGNISSYIYTGQEIKPQVVLKDGNYQLVVNTDYTVIYSNNTNVGTARVTLKGIGNYEGTIEKTFEITKPEIVKKNINTLIIENISNQIYTGQEIKPQVVIKDGNYKLVANKDYTVTYSNNTNVGRAKVTIKGIGNYEGAVEKTFEIIKPEIVKKNINTLTIGNISSFTYTGQEIKPQIVIKDENYKLVANKDYTVTYSNNTNVGKARVTLKGIGNYEGTIEKTFEIKKAEVVKKDISALTIENISTQKYIGAEIKPEISIKDGENKLFQNKDYTILYSENVDVGTAKVTIKGMGNYEGTVEKTFKILKTKIDSKMVRNLEDYIYMGRELTPAIIINDGYKQLVQSVDYDVSYINNMNAGTAKVKIVGIGNYEGEVEKTFSIFKRNINNVTVKNISKQLNGEGKETKLEIEVLDNYTKLKQGIDYKIIESKTDKENKTATIKIEGIGNYKGVLEKTFNINNKEEKPNNENIVEPQENNNFEIINKYKPYIIIATIVLVILLIGVNVINKKKKN